MSIYLRRDVRDDRAQRHLALLESRLDAKAKSVGLDGYRFGPRAQERIDGFARIFGAAFDSDPSFRADGLNVSREDTGQWFARETEAIQAYVAMAETAESMAANGTLFPVDNFGGHMARTVTQRELIGVGKARVAGPSSQDAPRVTNVAQESPRPVVYVDASYEFDLDDIALGEATGRHLDQYNAVTAREAVDETIDEIAASGHDAITEGGVINNTNVSSTTLPNKNWVGDNATPDQVIADISEMFTDMSDDTDGRAVPDTLALPPTYVQWMKARRLGDNTTNIKSYVEDILDLTILPWHRLKDGGSGGQDVAFLYKRDPKVIKLSMPVPFTSLPPEAKSRAFVTTVYAKTAGVIIDKPKYCRRAFLTDS